MPKGRKGKFKVPYAPIPDINVTSLVDVTLVLLIIFMVAAPIMQSSLNISVPQAASAQPSEKTGITIIVQKSGKILIDDAAVDEDGFDAAFNQVYKANSGQPVFLKADKDVPYAKVLTVIDALRLSGVADLGLVAEPGESKHGRRR
ncbi:biopolymer transporter ExbD [candidate division KSB1 bacterium]|nr:biopolymer transporter ExbD [candidate division KSB1 bacterium]